MKLLNIILSFGVYPSEWVQGLIFPIFKTDCRHWDLILTFMVFNKGSRLTYDKFHINDTEIERFRHYKYLGIMISLNRRFTHAQNDLTGRGQKAFFKLKKVFLNRPCPTTTFQDSFIVHSGFSHFTWPYTF